MRRSEREEWLVRRPRWKDDLRSAPRRAAIVLGVVIAIAVLVWVALELGVISPG